MKNARFFCSLFFLLLSLIATNTVFGQKQVLYQENFNGTSNSFYLNYGGIVTSTGANKWVVNNQYNGNGIYPNTPDESHTSGGPGITGAPASNYLHVHDTATKATANACYDTSVASDNFAQMQSSICTLGYDTVSFNFYYIAEGNVSDYGRLYYSLDGGYNWIWVSAVGSLSNNNLWKYISVSDPAFVNQASLSFGFRWTNTGASQPKDVSIGIDDISIIGHLSSVKPKLTISNVSPSVVCLGNNGLVTIKQSKPLCDGNYSIALSDRTGNFAAGTISFSLFMYWGDTARLFDINFPYSLPEGNCYKLKISRSDPPFLIGDTTDCFSLTNCGDSLQTLKPSVLFGPDTACTQSAIDVPFYSFGKYYKGNTYVAQLSDANGSFASPVTVGFLPDSLTYDYNNILSPFKVPGLIPDVPPGCNYYTRVIATSPSTIPNPNDYYGPFCLKQCDIQTNDLNDLHFCITQSTGDDTTISLKINQWNNNAKYAVGDSFLVQVLDYNYNILNSGSLGVVVSNTDTTLKLTIPNVQQLTNLLGYPGTGKYYLRLIALHSSTPWNTLGTLIRLSIGATGSSGSTILFSGDSLLCSNAGGTVYFEPTPYNFYSNYQWEIDPKLGYPPSGAGKPFYYTSNLFGLSFQPNTFNGYFWFTVREVNNGCYSPWFDSAHVRLIPKPDPVISSPQKVCQNDTVTLTTAFINDTYYEWSAAWGKVVDTSNNTLKMVFDSVGSVEVDLLAINMCGSSATKKNITVLKDGCDLNGTNELQALQNRLIISPNPANNQVQLVPNWEGEYNYELYSVLGNKFESGLKKGKSTIDVSQIPAGIYFIKVQFAGNEIQSKLIVIH